MSHFGPLISCLVAGSTGHTLAKLPLLLEPELDNDRWDPLESSRSPGLSLIVVTLGCCVNLGTERACRELRLLFLPLSLLWTGEVRVHCSSSDDRPEVYRLGADLLASLLPEVDRIREASRELLISSACFSFCAAAYETSMVFILASELMVLVLTTSPARAPRCLNLAAADGCASTSL